MARAFQTWLMGGIVLAAACLGLGTMASAEDFDWRNILGQNFVSPVRNQGAAGTCWAFAAVADLEAKYKLTRNDPLYNPDFSEQNLVAARVGDAVYGGWGSNSLKYFTTTGIVRESELHYTASNTAVTGEWGLQPGWQDRVAKSASWKFISGDTAAFKTALKVNGPFMVTTTANSEWYWPGGIVPPIANPINHEVLVVGFHDDPTMSTGGYWIVKNSWAASWGSQGYGYLPYGTPESHSDTSALDGPVYFTGAMATATWQGGSATWSDAGGNWMASGAAYAWENKETSAVFEPGGATNPVTLQGPVIAHGLTFSAGSTGYSFSGGSLTVTAGGITANESATIASSVTIGAPQTWTTAADRTLIVSAPIHTIISTLTVDGPGNTVLSGPIDNGGIINTLGAAGGGLVKNGSGHLTISGSGTFTGETILNAGLLTAGPSALQNSVVTVNGGSLAFSGNATVAGLRGGGNVPLAGGQSLTIQTAGDSAYAGSISGNGSLVKRGLGTWTVAVGTNSHSGGTSIEQGTLAVSTSSSMGSGPVEVAAGAALNLLGPASGLRGEFYDIEPTNLYGVLDLDFVDLESLTTHLADKTPSLVGYSSDGGRASFDFGSNGAGFPSPYNTAATNFEARFTGKFQASVAGTYTFFTRSDEGSMIWIDGKTVVNNNYFQRIRERSGSVTLTPGLHDIVIGYYQATGAYGLYADVVMPGTTRQRLSNALLSPLDQLPGVMTIGPLGGGGVVNLGANTLNVNSTTDSQFSGQLSGSGGLVKSGDASLLLSGASTFTGGTSIVSGTLEVDGSLAATKPVQVAAGAILAGSGRVGTVEGQGLVSPGGSPGILSVASFDPSTGLDFAFEFTSLGSPDYAQPANSKNDVLRVVDATAWTLAAANEVSIYLDVASLTLGEVFRGGFFTNQAVDFAGRVNGATTHYYVRGDGEGPHLFHSDSYYTLAEYNATLRVDFLTMAESALFTDGVVLGQVGAFTIVPEPSTLVLLASGLMLAVSLRRGRVRRGK